MVSSNHEHIDDFEAFWHVYLRDHAKPLTRWLHFVGISIALAGIVFGLVLQNGGVAIASIIFGAIVLWSAHRFVEHNYPSGFKRKLGWSILCGSRMYWLWLTGRLKPELERAGLS